MAAAALASALLLVVLPGVASAKIVLGHGAGGISLGDSGKRVRDVLGKPRTVQKYKGGQSWFFSGYWITLDTKQKVQGIEIKRPSETTDRHIGPGSSYAAFRRAYPSAKCHSDSFKRVYRICNLKTNEHGKAVLNRFVFSNDKTLSLVDVGTIGEFA